MAGTSISKRRTDLIPSSRDRQALWRRVGEFIRARRKELGMTSGDIVRVLGYSHLASCWKIEKGLEGLPTKRVYAWADVLQVPRDAFFRFVTGEVDRMEVARPGADTGERLTSGEAELLTAYRRLPPKYRRRLREHAKEYETVARTQRRPKKA